MREHPSLAPHPSRTVPVSPPSVAACRERGSAYVLTLMVLLILSLLGLVLALITQSEVEIGANERTVNRVFYSAEAGISASFANFILANGLAGLEFTQMDSPSSIYGTHVRVPPFLQVGSGPSELSQINQDANLKSVSYAVNASAVRFAKVSSTEEKTLGTKTLEMMMLITPTEEHSPIEDFKKNSGRYRRP